MYLQVKHWYSTSIIQFHHSLFLYNEWFLTRWQFINHTINIGIKYALHITPRHLASPKDVNSYQSKDWQKDIIMVFTSIQKCFIKLFECLTYSTILSSIHTNSTFGKGSPNVLHFFQDSLMSVVSRWEYSCCKNVNNF